MTTILDEDDTDEQGRKGARYLKWVLRGLGALLILSAVALIFRLSTPQPIVVAALVVGGILLFVAQAAIVVVDDGESAMVTIRDRHHRTFHTGVHLVPPVVADVLKIETGPWPVEIPIQETTTGDGKPIAVNPRCHVAVRDIQRWANSREDPRRTGAEVVTKAINRALSSAQRDKVVEQPETFERAVEDMISEPIRKRGLEVTEVEILDVKAPGASV